MSFWESFLTVPAAIWAFLSSPAIVFIVLVILFLVLPVLTQVGISDWRNGYGPVWKPIVSGLAFILVVWLIITMFIFFGSNCIGVGDPWTTNC